MRVENEQLRSQEHRPGRKDLHKFIPLTNSNVYAKDNDSLFVRDHHPPMIRVSAP
jgi:hypothetical protein